MNSSPNATPFPLGCKQPKKVQERKKHNIKMLPDPGTCLESRKKDNSKSGIKRKE